MGELRTFDLLDFVERRNCRYYLEAPSSIDTIDYALHFPFERVYSISGKEETVNEVRQHYWYNRRVQVFYRSHEAAFFELVRIIPHEYSAVVWLAANEFSSDLEQLAKCRPAKKDVMIIDNKYIDLIPLSHIIKFFGLTHKIQSASLGNDGKGLVLVPK